MGAAELRSDSLAARSASSILTFRAAEPARPAVTVFWVFCSLVLVVSGTVSGSAGSVTLTTSSAIYWFSIIVYCLRALMSKLAVFICDLFVSRDVPLMS